MITGYIFYIASPLGRQDGNITEAARRADVSSSLKLQRSRNLGERIGWALMKISVDLIFPRKIIFSRSDRVGRKINVLFSA